MPRRVAIVGYRNLNTNLDYCTGCMPKRSPSAETAYERILKDGMDTEGMDCAGCGTSLYPSTASVMVA